ncbi:acyltransferase family protein [Roseomonas sp. E05]|uniref:acyltransferase family protein n=1 Tax=Roseomonas sp. E05 TaxID=3046310 RepID=UPI0024BB464B|nr:acyltransferase family protein [Roseomonas sp. E05]MDJ0389128.1 acyltransferase family protein [Roseomonas sp. E05]
MLRPIRGQRWDYLDQLRAILMLAGIPYHAGLVYGSHAAWIVASPDHSEVFTWLLQFSHTFRMPAFFLLAGLFGMLLVRRRGSGAWWRDRLRRLGLPLATSLALVSPLLVLAGAVAQGGPENAVPGLLQAMRNPGADWTVHLWFLIYLLLYVSLLAGLWQLRGSLRLEQGLAAFQDAVERRPAWGGLALLGLGAATLVVAAAGKLLNASYLLGGIFIPAEFFANGLVFLCGALLAYRPTWLEAFTRPRWSIWAVALGAAALMAVCQEGEGDASRAATYFLMPIVGILFSHLLLSGARRWLDRSTPLSKAMVEGAMTIYLVHVVFVLWLSVAFLKIPLPPLLEILIIVTLSAVLSCGFHRLIRRSPPLMLLFNGVWPAPRWKEAAPPSQTVSGTLS